MPDVLVSVSFYFGKKDCNKSVYVMDGDFGIDELCIILLQTINDVLMGIIGAGLHQYLEGHHKDVANANGNFLTIVPLRKFVSYSTTCKPILVLMRLSTTELIHVVMRPCETELITVPQVC